MTALMRAGILAVLLAAGLDLGGCTDSASAREELQRNYARAPEFTGIEAWINSPPLTMASLRGKVVLVEFWTHECVNCMRTLPHFTRWYRAYADQGLVIVGVHTPELESERGIEGLEAAIEKFSIDYPIAQDNRYATWKAYDNQFWPASYLIDRHGTIVLKHFGEGGYAEMENAIRRLLADVRPRQEP